MASTDPTGGSHLRWDEVPAARSPVLLVAFEGWNDAGSAASLALQFLRETWGARAFCSVDPEEFYDFSSTRPTVSLAEDGTRRLTWPENTFSHAVVRDDLEVICLLGTEPELRWRTFCEQVTHLAAAEDVRLVVTLGALLADVPHTRPTTVYGTAYSTEVVEQLSLTPSRYEGPTGIVGVLHDAFARAGVPSASLWAAVPSYVPNAPSPKAALALVARLARLLEVDVDGDALAAAATDYEEQIDLVVTGDLDSQEYIAGLEEAWDGRDLEEATGPALVEEVERFLRDGPDR
ncbi:MAG: PAC2 family protein [Acidimicrobiia bacterium]|nr:PAC2 family protein [Acidimicrobiia bacterium]